jgi:MraZ protein
VNIPTPLLQYGKIEKECVVIGVSNRIEIWNQHIWEEYFNQSEESFADIAENLIDIDL